VQELSDIEGTAYFSDSGNLGREVSGLHLQLVDAQGKQVARARTEGDGTFYFEQVQAGNYTIRIDANQAASLKIHLTEALNVTIGPKSAWLKQVVKVSAD
jgi:Carboxypeptidase regulatory-like domain